MTDKNYNASLQEENDRLRRELEKSRQELEQLRQNEQRYRVLVENQIDLFTETDGDFNFSACYSHN